jgi:isocitrate dehydrogenase kinase/phosphatase
MYLKDADDLHMQHAIKEYGDALRELAGANIFPGDMLLKNFGVTRYGRVVFYDYDEISYLTDCNFREIPPPRSYDDELASEPYFSVGENDVFPEQLTTFLFASPRARDVFMEHHGDLTKVAFWKKTQERIRAGMQDDMFPYPQEIRFRRRFPVDT